MKTQASIFNPYSFLILGAFVDYFPSFLHARPSIVLAQIHFYLTDAAFILALLYALFKSLFGQKHFHSKRKNMGRGVIIIFALFFTYSCVKFLLQSRYDTGSIRMALAFTLSYPLLFLLPVVITRKEECRKLLSLLILFLLYIFICHIYAFAKEGYKIHILGGEFLSMLGILYFLALRDNELLKLSSTQSTILRALVITTYFMVGHRSGLIALLVGLSVYAFYYKKSAVKEVAVLITIVLIGAGTAAIVSPKILSGVEERASSTFDTSQDTYRGRFYNIFTVLEESQENPFIGKPLVLNESVQMKGMTETHGMFTTTRMTLVVTPHNLVLEWLLYYGWIGVLLGVSLLITAIRFVKRFLREHKGSIREHKIGVLLLCTMTHNLFYAFSNVTTMDIYTTFFLYFPLVILITVSRNEEKLLQAVSR